MSCEQDYLLHVNHVNLTYNKGKSNAFQSLFDVQLNIRRGEFVVIFGPSGCGKSSLLNCIAGLETPDSGGITIEGLNVSTLSGKKKVDFHRKKLGMIFQSYNLIPTLNVLDNVMLPQIFNNRKKKERHEKAMTLLKDFGIQEHWMKVPAELSGGQQQRIGIARAIVNDPPIILADEPIGNLDTMSANNVMQILSKLNREQGKTIILVSHNPENVIWGSHIIHMKDGKVTKEEFRDKKDIARFSDDSKGEVVDKEESVFDQIRDRFKGLSDEQVSVLISPLKSKLLVEFLVLPYNDSQMQTFEQTVAEYLAGTIEEKALFDLLDRSQDAFGVGLDKRVVRNFMKEIIFLSRKTQEYAIAETLNTKTLLVLEYITEFISLHISEEQMMALGNLIRKRISGEITYQYFKALLNRPLEGFSEKSVGIDRRIVEKVIRRIDLFLLVSYGIIQRRSVVSTVSVKG